MDGPPAARTLCLSGQAPNYIDAEHIDASIASGLVWLMLIFVRTIGCTMDESSDRVTLLVLNSLLLKLSNLVPGSPPQV